MDTLIDPTKYCWNYPVSKDVVVQVHCDSSLWRLKKVRSLIAQMIRQLNGNEEKDHVRWRRKQKAVGREQKAENASVTWVAPTCRSLACRCPFRGGAYISAKNASTYAPPPLPFMHVPMGLRPAKLNENRAGAGE